MGNVSCCVIHNSEIKNISTTTSTTSSARNIGVYACTSNENADFDFYNSTVVSNNTSNSFIGLVTSLYIGGKNISINNSNISINSCGSEVLGIRTVRSRSNSLINISDCNINVNNKITNKSIYHSACLLINLFHHFKLTNSSLNDVSSSNNGNQDTSYGLAMQTNVSNSQMEIYNNEILSKSSYNSYGIDLNETNCDLYNNNIRCELPIGVSELKAICVANRKANVHIMSGIYWAQPSYWNSGDNDSRGCAILCLNSSSTLIDESKGSTIISGGNCGVSCHEGSNVIFNSGTFKSPNHGGAYILSGSSGHCEINGGTFKSNYSEYTQEMLNGVHTHGGLYFGYNGDDNNPWTVNVKNATIIGGTQGVRVKSSMSVGLIYKGAIVHLYNCNVRGSSQDIFLDKSDYSENSYCYIEEGTVLYHDGIPYSSNNIPCSWIDGYAIVGLSPHIIDNRTQQTTTQNETSTQIETTTQGGE